MKTDLRDLTFLMPLKVDSIIRLENLLAVVRYIHRHFQTHIALLEVGAYDNRLLRKLLNPEIRYMFIEDKDPVFHRTKYRNLMAKAVKTTFLAIWDVDVLVDKKQIICAMEKLRRDDADMAYPYDGRFYDTSEIIRKHYMKKPQMRILHKNQARMTLIYGDDHRGGAFLANTVKYRLSGMENEHFYGWGPEDYERYDRWKNMRYRVYCTPGCMYHFTHPRDLNGRFNSERQKNLTDAERMKTIKSSLPELSLHT